MQTSQAMPNPNRGEVWIVDLGMVGKVRPCLIVSIPIEPQDRVLVTLVPHTTSVQGTRFKVTVKASFLKAGAFDAQQVLTVPQVKLVRKLGALAPDQFALVETSVRFWLGF
jgi:mRNA interferase MazF